MVPIASEPILRLVPDPPVRVCAGPRCVVELPDDADPRALYCSLRCRKAAGYRRERARDGERTTAQRPVEPVRAPFVEIEGEAYWSRRFRSCAWLGQVREASTVWRYRLDYGAEALPSVEAVEVADRLGLDVPAAWRA